MSARERVLEFLTDRWVSYRSAPGGQLVIPLVIAVPPTFLGVAKLHATFPSVDWISSVNTWFDAHPIVLAGVCFWPFMLVPFRRIGGYFDRRVVKRRQMNESALVALLNVLDDVVGAKQQYQLDRRKSLAPHRAERGELAAFVDVFCQPESRVKTLVQQCYVYFGWLLRDPSTRLRVYLARMGPKDVEQVEYCFPENDPPQRPLKMLQGPESALSFCKRTGKMLAIPDIQVEVRKKKPRYKASGDVRFADKGSLLCYPIGAAKGSDTPYVICIHTEAPGIFRERREDREMFETIMRRFEARIKYEYTQIMLRDELLAEE